MIWNLIDNSSPLRLSSFPFSSVSFVSIADIVNRVIGRYTKLTGTSIILHPGPTFGEKEYITFSVVPLEYEDPITSIVTLKLFTFIIFTILSDSLYPAEYIWLLNPKTDLIEFPVVKSTLYLASISSTDFKVLLFGWIDIT